MILVLGAGSGSTHSTPWTSGEDRGFLERLALARARSELREQVRALPLRRGLTVGDWAAQAVGRDRALDLWIRTRPPAGEARLYSDASCDLDVRVSPDELARQLLALPRESGQHGEEPISVDEIHAACAQWPTLWACGSSLPNERADSGRPVGWEDVSAAGIELARRAATADAVHALLRRAGQLKVTPARRLREFLESDEDVFDAVHQAVSDVAELAVECEPDQVAVARAGISLTELIRVLTAAYRRHYRGDAFHEPDFKEMALRVEVSEIHAVGLAPPPACYREPAPFEVCARQAPVWAGQTLTVSACHRSASGQELPYETRIELARFDALSELRSRLEALAVSGAPTVDRLPRDRPELLADVELLLSGARVEADPAADPNAALYVRVELPLARLWRIVLHHSQMKGPTPLPDDGGGAPASQEVSP